jgi:hypothetical protein
MTSVAWWITCGAGAAVAASGEFPTCPDGAPRPRVTWREHITGRRSPCTRATRHPIPVCCAARRWARPCGSASTRCLTLLCHDLRFPAPGLDLANRPPTGPSALRPLDLANRPPTGPSALRPRRNSDAVRPPPEDDKVVLRRAFRGSPTPPASTRKQATGCWSARARHGHQTCERCRSNTHQRPVAQHRRR